MPIGVIVNCISVLAGGVIGSALGHVLPNSLKEHLPTLFGMCSIAIGINSIIKAVSMTAVVLAILVGFTIEMCIRDRVYSVRVIGGAAVLSIICSFVGPLAALIQTIPGPVIGGISFLLYGMIGTSGLRILVDNHVDYSKNRNMILTSVIFVTGLSGVTLALGDVSLSGMTLAAIVGMIMSLVFYAFDKFHLSNDV